MGGVSDDHAFLYVNSAPTPADADAARRAAERAVALGPTSPEGYLARGSYTGRSPTTEPPRAVITRPPSGSRLPHPMPSGLWQRQRLALGSGKRPSATPARRLPSILTQHSPC